MGIDINLPRAVIGINPQVVRTSIKCPDIFFVEMDYKVMAHILYPSLLVMRLYAFDGPFIIWNCFNMLFILEIFNPPYILLANHSFYALSGPPKNGIGPNKVTSRSSHLVIPTKYPHLIGITISIPIIQWVLFYYILLFYTIWILGVDAMHSPTYQTNLDMKVELPILVT